MVGGCRGVVVARRAGDRRASACRARSKAGGGTSPPGVAPVGERRRSWLPGDALVDGLVRQRVADWVRAARYVRNRRMSQAADGAFDGQVTTRSVNASRMNVCNVATADVQIGRLAGGCRPRGANRVPAPEPPFAYGGHRVKRQECALTGYRKWAALPGQCVEAGYAPIALTPAVLPPLRPAPGSVGRRGSDRGWCQTRTRPDSAAGRA